MTDLLNRIAVATGARREAAWECYRCGRIGCPGGSECPGRPNRLAAAAIKIKESERADNV